MMDWVQSLPLLQAIGFLYVVIWLRAGSTYALGRGTRRVARRGRIAAFLESPRVERATEIVNRWGAPVVALSFLTVGFQTAANAAAGLTAMPLKRYLPALAIGGAAWAFIYATVGLVAFAAWFELFLRSPWAAVAVLALIVVLIAVLLRHRRRMGGMIGGDEDTVAAQIDAEPSPAPVGDSAETSSAGNGTSTPGDGTSTPGYEMPASGGEPRGRT